MGRMVFNLIPRDGKRGIWQGDAARYDRSDIGRYELHATEYADVCQGETLTAQALYCADITALLEAMMMHDEFAITPADTIGTIQRYLSTCIRTVEELIEYCEAVEVVYERLPLWVDQHSFDEHSGVHRGEKSEEETAE